MKVDVKEEEVPLGEGGGEDEREGDIEEGDIGEGDIGEGEQGEGE